MKVGIMQPYFLPYIGYFQLIKAVDTFIVYDNIQFSKKGWINRNRVLINGQDEYISLPLKKDSDYLMVNQRFLSDTFEQDKQKALRKIYENYRKAEHFEEAYPVIESCYNNPERNLFDFVWGSIRNVCGYLNIKTPLVISSEIGIDHQLKSQDKVIALCKEVKADEYINPIGGVELYDKKDFNDKGIDLQFIESTPREYKQFSGSFLSKLSILDVMMFNSAEEIMTMLTEYIIL
ncbi:hypothetical protein GVN16_14980 [Emticicia sp. CRIBPO]|uniref:WbqC family protein n=1 Tax=Emticicia sp. CRIBPO TaxID=2683258 RepID=UPI00141223BC|nr:WbqC family protein [Emticicia sp. CRIBPO]NBA87073.1 hypothetical protein [Emticicia sp. CRIBPO]